jgi:CspA family cold shock protein
MRSITFILLLICISNTLCKDVHFLKPQLRFEPILTQITLKTKAVASDNYIKGVVKWFDDSKGLGFITPDDGTKDVFVHFKAIVSGGFKTLYENQRVKFQVENTKKGLVAVNVSPI